MRLSLSHLRTYAPGLPEGRAAVTLLDEVGIEVKRHDGDNITAELLANRGDHHCYLGIAREVYGRVGGTLESPEVPPLTVGTSPIEVHIEAAECLAYTATRLTFAQAPGDLPADAIAVLESSDIHSISPTVDATNLAALEFGQPTHAFDASLIKGAIRIRMSTEGERAHLLFEAEDRELPAGILVIADDEKVLAVAGVIGCHDSRVTETSREIILESGLFDPVTVRKGARQLLQQTASSMRFERGGDYDAMLHGAARVVDLLVRHSGAKVDGETGVHGDFSPKRPAINVSLKRACTFIGADLEMDDAAARLERYGFAVSSTGDRISVDVPAYRIWDVTNPEDIYEELARSVGYDNLATALPMSKMAAVPTDAEALRIAASDVLVGLGFYEVITDGFYDRSAREKLGFAEGHPLWDHVELLNSAEKSNAFMKNNCLAQALEGAALNTTFKHNDLKAFEWTRTFHPDADAPNGLCSERPVLWLLTAGEERPGQWSGESRAADVLFLKGVLEAVSLELALPLRLDPTAAGALSAALHPTRQAVIRLDGEIVGELGEVHPDVARAFGIKHVRVSFVEISAVALQKAHPRPPLELPPTRPPQIRMLALRMPHQLLSQSVMDTLATAGGSDLVGVDIEAVYDSDEGRTTTYALTFDGTGSTTAEQVNAVVERMLAAVVDAYGARGLALR